jgi:iron complex outermembrane recepter protein
MSRIRLVSKLALSTILAGGCIAMPAFAQDKEQDKASSEQTDNKQTDNAAQIVVVGTRRTDRSVSDTASPVDVIGGQELASQPSANLLDAVKNIVPSFFVSQNTISDASSFVRSPSLRGLPADNILVQLNGKRYNRSALVQVYVGSDTALGFGSQGSDISAIPAIAVSNLQILREGATAQYGSDAIGGVINYGLREEAGFELQARYGQYYDNGGDGKSKQIAGYAGFNLNDRGFINISGEYTDDGQTSRGVTRPIALQFAAANPTRASQLPGFPGPVQIWGQSPNNGYKAVFNSSFDVTDNSTLYVFANIARSSADQSFNYRPPIDQNAPLVRDRGSGPETLLPGQRNAAGDRIDIRANGAFRNPVNERRCPANNPTCPANGFVIDPASQYNFTSLYPAGFTPRFVGVSKQVFGVIGYKGETDSGFKYDLSGSLSRNSLSLSLRDSLNASFGRQSRTSFFAGDLIQKELNLNLDVSYPLEAGLASPITLSAGSEYRRETYNPTVGDLQSYAAGPFAVQNLYRESAPGSGVFTFDSRVNFIPAASGYGGTPPASAGSFKQRNVAFYLGLETDLTDALSIGIAGRYENYNTFGGALVAKVNARYEFSDAFAIRGTIGSGFHAPSPGQNNVEILTTGFTAGNQVQTGTYRTSNPISQFYGARDLTPERSRNYGAGFVLKPTDTLSLTVDAYSVKVRNRIGISQNRRVTQANIDVLPALAAVGVGGDVNFFTNGFDSTTKGVDVISSYRTDFLGGKSTFTLAYNYNKSTVTRFTPLAISAERRFDISNVAPKHRVILSSNWQLGDFSLNTRTNYYSSWKTANDYPTVFNTLGEATDAQKFGAKFTSDLDVSYTFADHFTLTLGANNLFNVKPDRIAATASNPIFASTNSTVDGQIYPRSGGPFGVNGGFWYGRIRVKY